MILTIAAFVIALFFAANIGASGTAAAMGSAYGSGAVPNRKTAVILVAVFAVLGAVLGGGEVVTTISKGIIPQSVLSVETTVIVLAGACLTLFAANRIGIPLSTSEVTVGSIVGAGLAANQVYWGKLAFIASTWIVLPFVSFAAAYALGKLLVPREKQWIRRFPGLMPKLLSGLLIAAGCYEAFSAGMNNVANAVGPLVGAGLIDAATGIWLGSACLAAGAIALGGKVLETNGKKITSLSLLQGSAVSFTGGTLVVISSLFGLPVPLTQTTTMAIIGVGAERNGFSLLRMPIVQRIFAVWIISPTASLLVSYGLIKMIAETEGSVFTLISLPFLIAAFIICAMVRQKIYAKAKRCNQAE